MKRICVITQDLALGGGVFTKLAAFLDFAASRQYRCDLYFPSGGKVPEEQVRRVRECGCVDRIVPVSVPPKIPYVFTGVLFARALRVSSDYDAFQLVSGSITLGRPFLRSGRPFAAWIAGTHGADCHATPRTRLRHYLIYNPVTDELTRRQEAACAAGATRILPVSSYSAREVMRELEVPPEKVQVVPVPIDCERFYPASCISGADPCILSVGRLDRRKDFPTLLRAFGEVARRIDKARLHVAGSGKEEGNLWNLTRDLGLGERVAFLGAVDDERLAEEYRRASLFALASRQEGLGIVFLEAMASGLPVVATDCGGAADPVVPGETGFLVPVGDWKALAHAMIGVLERPGDRMRFGRAARARAENLYSRQRIFAQFDEIYREAFGFDVHPSRSSMDAEGGLALSC